MIQKKLIRLLEKTKYFFFELLLYKKIKQFFKISNKNKNFILADRCDSLTYWHLTTAFGAAIVARAFNSQILCLQEDKPLKNPASYFIYRYGLNTKTVKIKKLIKNKYKKIEQEAQKLFNNLKKPNEILKIKYKNILIGPEIYDDILSNGSATVRQIDFKTKESIRRAISTVEATNEILRRFKVKAGCCTHTKCSFDGIWIRVLLSKNIHVFQSFGGLGAIVKFGNPEKNYPPKIMHPNRPPKTLIKEFKENRLNEATEFLNKRRKGLGFDWDAQAAYFPGKKKFDRKEFLKKYKLSLNKKTIFVMLHAMSDGPHTKGLMMFDDFYHWFIYTLNRAGNIKKYNWIFKDHPRRLNYPDECDLKTEIERLHYDNIAFVASETINSSCIEKIADGVVTAAGTAGLEYPSLGIPALICCKNGYHGLGCCHEAKNRLDYDVKLSKFSKKLKVSADQKKQSLAAFFLMNDLIKRKLINGIFELKGNDEAINMSPNDALERLSQFFQNEQKINSASKEFDSLVKMIQDEKHSNNQILLLNYDSRVQRFKV